MERTTQLKRLNINGQIRLDALGQLFQRADSILLASNSVVYEVSTVSLLEVLITNII